MYDSLLNARLTKWFKSEREQAGAQKGRGCTELILTLYIIIAVALHKKWPLYVTFVDFSKAYDRVPRGRLLRILKQLGCGYIMLAALVSIFNTTGNIFGAVIITYIAGVKQGSPFSPTLFIIYVSDLIRRLRESPDDSYLTWLHSLMLMDDTALLATSRDAMQAQLLILHHYCEDSGMRINAKKTQFLAFGSAAHDRTPFILPSFIVERTDRYLYLGAIVTESGKINDSIRLHAIDKTFNLNKLMIFLGKNADAPFKVKEHVLHAAFDASIGYSCETWLNGNTQPISRLWSAAIRATAGVKTQKNLEMILV